MLRHLSRTSVYTSGAPGARESPRIQGPLNQSGGAVTRSLSVTPCEWGKLGLAGSRIVDLTMSEQATVMLRLFQGDASQRVCRGSEPIILFLNNEHVRVHKQPSHVRLTCLRAGNVPPVGGDKPFISHSQTHPACGGTFYSGWALPSGSTYR